jgi:hypothetical protein
MNHMKKMTIALSVALLLPFSALANPNQAREQLSTMGRVAKVAWLVGKTVLPPVCLAALTTWAMNRQTKPAATKQQLTSDQLTQAVDQMRGKLSDDAALSLIASHPDLGNRVADLLGKNEAFARLAGVHTTVEQLANNPQFKQDVAAEATVSKLMENRVFVDRLVENPTLHEKVAQNPSLQNSVGERFMRDPLRHKVYETLVVEKFMNNRRMAVHVIATEAFRDAIIGGPEKISETQRDAQQYLEHLSRTQ